MCPHACCFDVENKIILGNCNGATTPLRCLTIAEFGRFFAEAFTIFTSSFYRTTLPGYPTGGGDTVGKCFTALRSACQLLSAPDIALSRIISPKYFGWYSKDLFGNAQNNCEGDLQNK